MRLLQNLKAILLKLTLKRIQSSYSNNLIGHLHCFSPLVIVKYLLYDGKFLICCWNLVQCDHGFNFFMFGNLSPWFGRGISFF